MKERAEAMGANGVIGCKLDYEAVGSVVLIIVSGRAVKLK